MVRFFVALLFAALGLCTMASAKDAAHPARKPAHAAKPATMAPSPAGNINAPSTDFSTVERPGEDQDSGPSRGMHPEMSPSGNIGLGTGF